MEEILTYILFGSGIILNLTMCFIAGITIGKLIDNEKKDIFKSLTAFFLGGALGT